ncbi:hypothetical protein LguiA_000585 [Lonicera macranthoides]
MEITELNILSDFEAGIKCLQNNPSLFSRFFSLQVYGFWTWGALILALIATFTTLINRIKLFIFRVRTTKSLSSSSSTSQHLQNLDDDFDFTDDDSSSSDPESDDEEFESKSSFEGDEDFRVAGSGFSAEEKRRSGSFKLRRRRIGGHRFSWSDFAAGKSVVQLWDGFGLGLNFDDSSGSEISIWDLDRDEKINSFFGWKSQIPAVAMSSPAVVLSADANNFSAHDRRVGGQIPTIYADWLQQGRHVVGLNSGCGDNKVYVRDGITGGITVGDMRNVKTPLENLTESDGDKWWDADGVIF